MTEFFSHFRGEVAHVHAYEGIFETSKQAKAFIYDHASVLSQVKVRI